MWSICQPEGRDTARCDKDTLLGPSQPLSGFCCYDMLLNAAAVVQHATAPGSRTECAAVEEVGCKSPYNCEWWKGADFKLGSSSTAMQCNVVQMECKTAKDFKLHCKTAKEY